jgi:TP901 family phage tail tape measure protein
LKIGELFAELKLDDRDFRRGMGRVEREMRSLDQHMKAIGGRLRRMGRTMALPLAAAAGAAVKVATTFDTEMTRIETLVGIAADQVNEWRAELLRLGPALGRTPTELARALFVVTSAGARGAEAMEILERAGMAAAIGLGETEEVARTVTAAMQAYSRQGLTAAEATDILVATVREGNLEASSLAGSLGRVLGISAQVGVSFADMNAFIATFSRVGVSAEEAVTALRGIMSVMLKPTKQTQDALAGVGMTMADLREMATKPGGLVNALATLVNAFKGNEEALALVIPNIRALAGFLGTAGAQGEAFAEITRNIHEALGITAAGFERVSETAGFKFRRMLAELTSAGIELGNQLLPVITEITTSLTNLIGEISAGNVTATFRTLFTGLLRGIADIVGFIERHPTMLSFGLVGWVFLGPAGAAGIGALGALIDEIMHKLFGATTEAGRHEDAGVCPAGHRAAGRAGNANRHYHPRPRDDE